MNMFETVSQHIGELEKAVTNMQSASSSTGGSREEKQCIPPNLSVSVKTMMNV